MKKIYSLLLVAVVAVLAFQANAAMWLVGSAFNGWNTSGNVEMTYDSDTHIYSWQGSLTGGNFAFFKDSQAWASQRGPQQNDANPTGDWEATNSGGAWNLAGAGEYLIQYNYLNDQAKIAPLSAVTHTYTVAGSPVALFGTQWDPSNTDNDMTLANGVYTWSKSNVLLSAGNIEFKCVRDHAWGVEYPSGNYVANVPEDGTYDVVITLDADSHAVNCTLTETGSAVINHTYYLVGTLNGWTAQDEDYEFDDQGNGVFTLTETFSGEFKIVDENGAWWSTSSATTIADSTPLTLSEGGDGNNMTLSASSEYTLTLTVSGGTKTLTVSGFPSADTPAHTYVLRGDINEWAGDAYAFSYQGNGVYTLTTTFSGEFKVVRDGSDWLANESAFTFNYVKDNVLLNAVGGGGNNMTLSGTAREYTLTISDGNGSTPLLTISGLPQLPQAYYLVGAFNEWASGVPFTQSDGVFTLTQSLGGTGATGEFLVTDQYGQYLGGATDESVYTLHVGWHSVELATEAQGKKNLYIVDAGNYTFTIKNGVLNVTGWAGGASLADALAGTAASTDVISDELTVVCVHGGKVYATDGNGGWVRLDGVSDASQMRSGDVIDSYQVSASVSLPRQEPSVAVNGALRSADGGNAPALREIYLSKAYAIGEGENKEVVYPTPGEVVTIRGYFFLNGDVPCMYAYSNKSGVYLNLDDDAGMTEGRPYAIDVAVSLAEPWSAPSGAPRRVSPSDSNAYTNLRGTVVGDPYVETGVADVSVEREVAGVKYVSLDGRTGDRPFDGVNIVVTTYADGSVSAVKVLR